MSEALEYILKLTDMLSPAMQRAAQLTESAAGKIQAQYARITSSGRTMGSSVDDLRKRLENINQVRFSTKIESEFRQASRAARELQKDIERLESMGNPKAGGGSRLLGLAAGGLGAYAAGDFLKSSVESAMNFGATTKSFEVLTGSAEKGRNLANELNKLQQNTILGPEVFKSAQTLMSFGVATEQVVKIQKQLGDVSMGNKDKFDALTLAYAQTQAAGKLMGQDLLQYINAGFNPLQVMSERWQEFGFKQKQSVGQLKELMSDGAISAQMVAKAFEMATSKGGKFADMMDTIGQTTYGRLQVLQGQFESFKISIGEALMPYADGLMSIASRTLDVLNITKNVPQKLAEERSEITSLLGVVGSLNQGNEFRHRLLQQLVTKYPDLFKNIDIEKVKNSELLAMLNDVNQAYNKRISLATSDLIMDNAKKQIVDAQREYTRYMTMIELEKRGNAYESHKMASMKDQFSWGYQTNSAADRIAWLTSKAGGYKAILDQQQSILGNESKIKAGNEMVNTLSSAYSLSHDPARLKELFAKNSTGKAEFMKMASQITFSGNVYNTNGGGAAFISRLGELMNPAAPAAGGGSGAAGLMDAGSSMSKSVNNGGQRSIIINIAKQVGIETQHVSSTDEGAKHAGEGTLEVMRRALRSVNGTGTSTEN